MKRSLETHISLNQTAQKLHKRVAQVYVSKTGKGVLSFPNIFFQTLSHVPPWHINVNIIYILAQEKLAIATKDAQQTDTVLTKKFHWSNSSTFPVSFTYLVYLSSFYTKLTEMCFMA